MGYQEIYVHIPFCRSRCNYCDFLSFASSDADLRARYVQALLHEIVLRADRSDIISSIYLGGGTPTVLSAAQLCNIIQALRDNFLLADDCEITVEFNVATVDLTYLQTLHEVGVNRLSCGAQSFCDAELASMGRLHRADDVAAAVDWAHTAGFDNISIDLIYGLPGQTLSRWRDNLQQAMALPVQHISLYGLQLDNESRWGRLAAAGQLAGADEDLSADMFEYAMDVLPQQGWQHYEIANFAMPGYRSRHNCGYWQRLNYLGLGLGASGCCDEVRTVNTRDLAQYCNALFDRRLPPMEYERLSRADTLAEAAFLALRMSDGLNIADMSARYGVDFAEYYQKQLANLTARQLLCYDDGIYRLTRRGVLLGNIVFAEFLPD